jgi:hypothetical protein
MPKSAGVSNRTMTTRESQLKIWLDQSPAARQAMLRAKDRSISLALRAGARGAVSATGEGGFCVMASLESKLFFTGAPL